MTDNGSVEVMPEMSVVSSIINPTNKGETPMDNQEAQELFEQYHNGEIDVFELWDELETSRFDGDVFDYL